MAFRVHVLVTLGKLVPTLSDYTVLVLEVQGPMCAQKREQRVIASM